MRQTSLIFLTLIVAVVVFEAGCIQSSHHTSAAKHNLTGAWHAKVQFSTGAFAEVKDLEFMYVFNDGGTMTESSNYDANPPVPPAYGVWRRVNDTTFAARYAFYTTKAPSPFQNLSGGLGWIPDGRGVLNDTLIISSDGRSFLSRIHLDLFNQSGAMVPGGGEATGIGMRIEL